MNLSNAFLIFLAILAGLTPPGLCSCWLIPEVATVHPHVSEAHAHSEHSHEYLLQLSQTTRTEIAPLVVLQVKVWISLVVIGSIWWLLVGQYFREGGWLPDIPIPPPKVFSV